MEIRKGNTIVIKWQVLTNGQPLDLKGRNLKIFITSATTCQEVLHYETEGNIIIFKVEGKSLMPAAKYDLTLYENYGKPNQAIVDACNAFTLVNKSCEAGQQNLRYSVVELSSAIQAIIGVYPTTMRVTFSPYGSNEEYDMGQVSGELFDKFFDEVPENPIIIPEPEPEPEPEPTPMYPYYAYADMGFGVNFRGIGEWDEITEEVSNG